MHQKNIHIGLKMNSLSLNQIPAAVQLWNRKIFQYIELYIVPESFGMTSKQWANLEIPIILHAPHVTHGINLANKDCKDTNLKAYDEVKKFADHLNSQFIIAHSGNNGTIEEVVKQLLLVNDSRIAIENKPLQGLQGETCIGCVPEEIREIMIGANLDNFVLDFGHAIYAARSLSRNPYELIEQLSEFSPCIFHLADGDSISEVDMHLNLGKGNLNIGNLLNMLPDKGHLTLETPRQGEEFGDFIKDVKMVRELSR